MKKVLAVVAVVCVVFAAGAAFAQPRPEGRRMPPQRPQHMPEHREGMQGQGMHGCGHGGEGFGRMMLTPDMPKEIRAKTVELAKLRIDLAAVLTEKPIDRDAAIDIFLKMQSVEDDIEAWKFSKKLDMIESFGEQHEHDAQHEHDHDMPPAPEPEAPESPEAPEAPAEEATE